MPEFLKHKKFQVGILTTLSVFLAQYAAAYTSTEDWALALGLVNWVEVMAPILTAIGAQGVADFGKERAKVEANGAARASATED